MKVFVRFIFLLAVGASLMGCFSLFGGGAGLGGLSGPRQELPVPLEVTIHAAENANPAENGRPSPVVVSVFEMSGSAAFQGADFFALQEPGAAVLGDELAHTEQHILLPGETRVIRRTAANQSRFLGVVAGFRDLEGSTWRAVAPLPAPYLAGRVITAGTSPTKRLYVVVTEKSIVVQDAADR